jgi:hypothetical protein
MKNKIVAFTIVALTIFGSALLHVSPAIAIAMIAEGGELTRALGTALLVCSMSGLIYLHSLNGSFRSKKKA